MWRKKQTIDGPWWQSVPDTGFERLWEKHTSGKLWVCNLIYIYKDHLVFSIQIRTGMICLKYSYLEFMNAFNKVEKWLRSRPGTVGRKVLWIVWASVLPHWLFNQYWMFGLYVRGVPTCFCPELVESSFMLRGRIDRPWPWPGNRDKWWFTVCTHSSGTLDHCILVSGDHRSDWNHGALVLLLVYLLRLEWLITQVVWQQLKVGLTSSAL